jgi:hypothetical protein
MVGISRRLNSNTWLHLGRKDLETLGALFIVFWIYYALVWIAFWVMFVYGGFAVLFLIALYRKYSTKSKEKMGKVYKSCYNEYTSSGKAKLKLFGIWLIFFIIVKILF